MARIELSNIGGGGGTTLSLTTTGTSGAATLAGSVLNIPVYQGQLTLTTTGTSGAATLSGDILNIPQYSGGTPAGNAEQVQFNSTPAGSFAASTAFVFNTSGPFLRVGASAPNATVGVNGAGTLSGTTSLHVRNSSSVDLLKVNDDGQFLLGKNGAGATQSTASIEVSTSDTNTGIAIVPKGTGAITAQIPNGSASGGDARGSNSIDWQKVRNSSNQVASGLSSVILGGENNRASGSYSIAGGYTSLASGQMSVAIGGWPASGTHTASGSYSTTVGGFNSTSSGYASTVIGGNSNTASAQGAIVTGGQNGIAYLSGQRSIASGRFASTNGDAQTSDCRVRRSITGTGIQELTIDGAAPAAGNRLILPAGASNGRTWNAIVQLSAICQTAGGTVTLGESFIGTYNLGIKRIVNATSLVGTVQNMITAQADTNMSSSVVTITADDTNESLKIEFTPPTGANASTVIRVVATVYLTEVGY